MGYIIKTLDNKDNRGSIKIDQKFSNKLVLLKFTLNYMSNSRPIHLTNGERNNIQLR